MDDSEQVVRQCGLLVQDTYLLVKQVVQALETKQGWADLGKRLQKNGLNIAMELYAGVDDIKKQKYYEGGYQIGAILKQVFVPTEGVVARQVVASRRRSVRLHKYLPWLGVVRQISQTV